MACTVGGCGAFNHGSITALVRRLGLLYVTLTRRWGCGSTRAAPNGLAAPPPSPARADGHAPLRGGITAGSVARLLARLEARSGPEPKEPREGLAEPPGAEGGGNGRRRGWPAAATALVWRHRDRAHRAHIARRARQRGRRRVCVTELLWV